MDLWGILEEEVGRVLEGSDAGLVAKLVEAYRLSGTRGVKEELRRALAEWGVDVADLED